VIADVSDKGMHSALLMAVTRSIVRASMSRVQEPAVGIASANRLICAGAAEGMFVTLFYAGLRPNDGNLAYVNAGHNPAMVAAIETAVSRYAGGAAQFDDMAILVAKRHLGDID
jgi:sigma-B regulation protein RsbU (phosphoserine phosphatase)